MGLVLFSAHLPASWRRRQRPRVRRRRERGVYLSSLRHLRSLQLAPRTPASEEEDGSRRPEESFEVVAERREG